MMQFARAGAICHGVDTTEIHPKLTALNATLRGHRVDLHETDVTRLPFEDGSIDCVYSFGALHHIPEIDQVLKEIHHVPKLGGTVMIALCYQWSAFHISWIIMANGLRNGWLFTKGYRGLLETIEMGAEGVHVKPYVRLFSRSDCARLMAGFSKDDLVIQQLHEDHFWPGFVARTIRPFLSRLEGQMGSYVCCKRGRSSLRQASSHD